MAKGTAVGRSSAEQDRLSELPPELLQTIVSYLLVDHRPDKGFEQMKGIMTDVKKGHHTLDYLAATCKALRTAVMDFAKHFLVQHKDVTRYKLLKTPQRQAERNFLRRRGGLLNWFDRHCGFCGRPSRRTAILRNGMHCCLKCDDKQWPDKITKTNAKELYDLKDHHIFPHRYPKLSTLPKGLPRVPYGTFYMTGTPTTMFVRRDVEALGEFLHGNLERHLLKRQARREERKAKMKANKERREGPQGYILSPGL